MAKYFIYPTEGRETSASVDSGSIPDGVGLTLLIQVK